MSLVIRAAHVLQERSDMSLPIIHDLITHEQRVHCSIVHKHSTTIQHSRQKLSANERAVSRGRKKTHGAVVWRSPAARQRDRNRSVLVLRPHALCLAVRTHPSRFTARVIAPSLSPELAPHAYHGRPISRRPAVAKTWP
ncbi:unnamed protein product [Danaus chrysippus]|uniref:(African queen) hypothetical protein n=1 Tax=Danaus chrysippus TaxID=151541 RepID=A0A8J2MX67_9NEOP|nr:unnamed protein product [Danaus chrysippus]